MRSNRPDEKWKSNFLQTLSGPTGRGDYKTALSIARSALREYPDEFLCRYQYAKLLGDYADELPLASKKKAKREAVQILKTLLPRLRELPAAQRFGVTLNYYYQGEDFRGMYQFGLRYAKTDKKKSNYARGLGAVLIAFELYERGHRRRSQTWAKKAVHWWDRYDFTGEKYYFAYYSAAKAHALADNKVQALKCLQKAARLAKRPLSDWEFADVLKLIG